MGQIRHGSATTTHAVRAALQRSQASLAQLIQDLGINPKTVAKWHGITRLPDVEGDKPGAKSSKATRLGSFILISQRFRQLKGTSKNCA